MICLVSETSRPPEGLSLFLCSESGVRSVLATCVFPGTCLFFGSREGRAISSGNLCFSPHLEKFGEVANLVARLKLDSTCMRASSYDA